jgi:hypothetical protein
VGSMDALSPPVVTKITNIRSRNRAREAVANAVSRAHVDITTAVLDLANGYGDDAAVAIGLRDAEKVSVVLGANERR